MGTRCKNCDASHLFVGDCTCYVCEAERLKKELDGLADRIRYELVDSDIDAEAIIEGRPQLDWEAEFKEVCQALQEWANIYWGGGVGDDDRGVIEDLYKRIRHHVEHFGTPAQAAVQPHESSK